MTATPDPPSTAERRADDGRPSPAFSRRQALVVGASSALAVGGMLAGPAPLAYAAPSPKLPGELGRQNNLKSRYGGRAFDHIRVAIGGDNARLFVPQGIVRGTQNVPVLWLYHGAGSSEDALTGGFRAIGERAVSIGMIAICQNLGGTQYTNPTATRHQVNGWNYLSGIYGVDRNFLRGTSHGGAMGVEVLATSLIPNVVGSFIVNGVYDIEHLYLNGSDRGRYSVAQAFGNDLAAIRRHNPARHRGTIWSGKRIRVLYSTPDSSDATTPPAAHARALIAAASPSAVEASFRTHTGGHQTPSYTDLDNQTTISRWTEEIRVPPPAPVSSEPIAQWNFAEAAAPFAAATVGTAALVQATGSAVTKIDTPFGGGVQFNGTTDYLRIPAASVGALNVGASTNQVTIAAWVYSVDTNAAAIAGCWQENTTNAQRSYALFNDLPTYGGDDLVCMSVSKLGGTTSGYTHSIDYAADPRKLTRGVWQFHVGTYDGASAVAYLDGAAAPFSSFTDSKGKTYAKNPYAYPAGLNAKATDFVVGASTRNGAPINLHRGAIAGLRVWNRALTAAQIAELYAAEKTALDPPVEQPQIPAPVAGWEFGEAAAPFASSVAGGPALQQGLRAATKKVTTPFGGGVELNGTSDFLYVPQAEAGRLNVGATTNRVTIAAWVFSADTNNAMIAGCWQESGTDPRRSYALFNDLPTFGGDDQVCMHVSKLGGPTPGYAFSRDYSAEPRRITRGVWQFQVGTYDGAQAISYLNGIASPYPSYTDGNGATYAKNPYQYPDGLNATPIDFLVGAVVREGSLINLHKGRIAKLRVWDVALDAAQIAALYDAEKAVVA